MTDKELFLELIQSFDQTAEQIGRKLNKLENKQFKDTNGKNALHHARTLTAVQVLYHAGISVNETDNLGNTPLHYLAKSDAYLEIVKFLSDKANYKIRNRDGKRPCDIATTENQKVLVTQHRYDRSVKTEIKFFDYRRIEVVKKHYLANFLKIRGQARTQTDEIRITGLARRRLIAADFGACQSSFASEDIIKSLDSSTAIAQHSGWYNAGFKNPRKLKANQNWSGEAMVYQLNGKDYVVKSQFKPVIGQLNNFFMNGLGSYGDATASDILHIFKALTASVQEADIRTKSRTLARLLLDAMHEGVPLDYNLLKTNGLNVSTFTDNKELFNKRMIRIYHLITVKEISRRLVSDYKDGQKVEKLPIGMALVMSLELLKGGQLSLSDVFAHDAPYGLPTPSNLSSLRQMSTAKEKMRKIIRLYGTTFPDFEFKRSDCRDKLGLYFRGENDTDSEYESSDDERPVARR
jgi:hypothetical protein